MKYFYRMENQNYEGPYRAKGNCIYTYDSKYHSNFCLGDDKHPHPKNDPILEKRNLHILLGKYKYKCGFDSIENCKLWFKYISKKLSKYLESNGFVINKYLLANSNVIYGNTQSITLINKSPIETYTLMEILYKK
jgi:hypothetical protein